MRITLNGKARNVEGDSTIAQLVESLGYGRRQVVVECNGEAVDRARFGDVVLRNGDVIEVVRPVQGGAL